MILSMEQESQIIRTVTDMMGTGNKIKSMGSAYTTIKREIDMKGSGKRVLSMGRESNIIKMAINMMGIGVQEVRRDMEFMNLPMEMIKDVYIRENGKREKWMAKPVTTGEMGVGLKAITRKI